MTDFIAAIDLGTSHFTGIVGEHLADGAFNIVATERLSSSSGMRRGNINNFQNAATAIKDLVERLNVKLDAEFHGAVIERLYIGVGGMTLKTVKHYETKEIEADKAVTPNDIKQLNSQCRSLNIEPLELFDVIPTGFYLDGVHETEPDSMTCREFRANYNIVTGLPKIRKDIENTVHARAGYNVAGIIVAPVALADALFSDEEKALGCALVDFGYGVTSVTVYYNGILLGMAVIPLGANLITKDITNLTLTEADAEKYKLEYGSAIVVKEDVRSINVQADGGDREIKISNLNAVVEGGATEIVANVVARIAEYIDPSMLGSGIVITGGAAALPRLSELIRDKTGARIRVSAIRQGLVANHDELLGQPEYMTAIAVMLKGNEQCVKFPPEEPIPVEKPIVTPQQPTPMNKGGKKPPVRVDKHPIRWIPGFLGLDKGTEH